MSKVRAIMAGWMRIACAVALLSLAFAHKPPQVIAAAIETAGLVLPDGSYGDICIGEEGIKHPAGSLFCEACMLAGATALPTPDADDWLVTHFAALDNRRIDSGGFTKSRSITQPRSRGPPFAA